MKQPMRAKIHYYLRFVFGLSRSELLAMYSMLLIISLFIGYGWVREYVDGQEEAFDFRPVFWSGELAKIPAPRKWALYSKWRFVSNSTNTERYSPRGKSSVAYGSSSVDRRSKIRAKDFLPFFSVGREKGLGSASTARRSWGRSAFADARSKTQAAFWTLDINQADSVAWVGLKGIGSGYAKRILSYRERLGGFYAVDQLKEIYGMDTLWVEANKGHLLVGEGIYKKIALNRVDWNAFRHPYISYAQVKVFLAYRKHHPVLRDFQALEQIKLLDLTMWNRLRPYLSFEP